MAKISSSKVISLQGRRKRLKPLQLDNKIMVLAVIIAIGIGAYLGIRPNAYQIIIDGKMIGAVKDKEIVEEAKQTVMKQLETAYGSQIKFEEEVQTKKYRAKKRDYIAPSYLVTYMRKNMNVLISFREIVVDGKSIGIVASDKEIEKLKEALKKAYYGDRDIEVAFGKKVEIKEVFAKEEDLINEQTLFEKCTVTTPKVIDYEVGKGDSLSGIAYKLRVSIENILKENPGFSDKTVLKIGEVIKVRINEPLLPLTITKDNTTKNAGN